MVEGGTNSDSDSKATNSRQRLPWHRPQLRSLNGHETSLSFPQPHGDYTVLS